MFSLGSAMTVEGESCVTALAERDCSSLSVDHKFPNFSRFLLNCDGRCRYIGAQRWVSVRTVRFSLLCDAESGWKRGWFDNYQTAPP